MTKMHSVNQHHATFELRSKTSIQKMSWSGSQLTRKPCWFARRVPGPSNGGWMTADRPRTVDTDYEQAIKALPKARPKAITSKNPPAKNKK
jgi:hypothetical protein